MASNDTSPVLYQNDIAAERIYANKTLAAADSGVAQIIMTDALTLALPASATVGAGYVAYIVNGGAAVASGPVGTGSNGTVGITLTGASGDGITGGGFTAAANKFANNVKATAQQGDYIKLIASGANSAAAWNVLEIRGNWARTT